MPLGSSRKGINTTHGQGRPATPTYRVWLGMRQRCVNPHCAGYSNYGGRGIKVCARWDSFEAFLSDMGERPAELFLDRIDNNGNYEPSNCRWATRTVQNRNSRHNRLITFRGVTLPISEWAERQGLRVHLVQDRIARYGWSPEEALTLPLYGHHVGPHRKTWKKAVRTKKQPLDNAIRDKAWSLATKGDS